MHLAFNEPSFSDLMLLGKAAVMQCTVITKLIRVSDCWISYLGNMSSMCNVP